MKILFLIPARGGSKGLPGKNIKELNGKALINHAVDFARNFTDDNNICVSSDSDEIIGCAEKNKLKVPFKRPKELASDKASTNDVIKHSVDYYASKGIFYDILVLLQPTTPFRNKQDFLNMINIWDNKLDLLVSVKESKASPYFNLFEEDNQGYLKKCKKSSITRRQDSPTIYSMNGSIYIFNVNSINLKSSSEFKLIKKYIMDDPIYSIDIDNHLDFKLAQAISSTFYEKNYSENRYKGN